MVNCLSRKYHVRFYITYRVLILYFTSSIYITCVIIIYIIHAVCADKIKYETERK